MTGTLFGRARGRWRAQLRFESSLSCSSRANLLAFCSTTAWYKANLRVRSWTRQASYTCRYRLADIVPSRLPCGPNLVAAATAAECRRAGRNPCREVVAVAPFLLSVRLELPGWKCSAGRDARSLGQARASGRDRPRGQCAAATGRRGLWRVGRTDRPGVPLCVAIRQVAHAAAR